MQCPCCKSDDIWTDSHEWAGRCRSCGHDGAAGSFVVKTKEEIKRESISHLKHEQYKFMEYNRDLAWRLVKQISKSKTLKDVRAKARKLMGKIPQSIK